MVWIFKSKLKENTIFLPIKKYFAYALLNQDGLFVKKQKMAHNKVQFHINLLSSSVTWRYCSKVLKILSFITYIDYLRKNLLIS